MKRLTLDRIKRLEPEVGVILAEAERDASRRDELDALYSRYKARLSRLVGWAAPRKELRGSDAYDIIIKALCDTLQY